MIDLEYSGIPSLAVCNPDCISCGLNRSSGISVYGNGAKRMLIVFDAQTSIMATSKSYGIGHEFTFIKNQLYKYGIVAEEDCWVTSAVQCYSPNITSKHMDCCRPRLLKTISMLKPKVILAVGELAAASLFSGVIPGSIKLERTHGFIHNCRPFSCWAVASFVPGSTRLRYSVLDRIVERDIHLAVMALQTPYKAWKEEKQCVSVCSQKEAVKRLAGAIANTKERWMALDYETTGLKPHNANQKLVSCAICESLDESWSFMVDDKVVPLLKEFLNAPHIKKIAHNMAFELSWSAAKLGTFGRRMELDTMLLAHTIDNRDTKITGIKFLAPMLLGCAIWNKHIEPYLDADKKEEMLHGENALNNIHRIQPLDLLTYNAIDSLVEFRVAAVLIPMLKQYNKTLPTPENIRALSF